MKAKFIHLADCHIGSWVDPRMKKLPIESLARAVEIGIEENIDFALLSGDIFNTAIPGIDLITETAKILKKLREKKIRVYCIPGSHDFSPSGRTILNLLDETEIIKLATQYSFDETSGKIKLHYIKDETGVKICGMVGRRNMLDKNYYEKLDRDSLEQEEGFKIFMLHTAITELKSKDFEKMESIPISLFPKHQNYYAAGHVHEIIEKNIAEYGKIVFPGPLFPTDFRELEKLKTGSFYLNRIEEGKMTTKKINIMPKNYFSIKLNCNGKIPQQIQDEINKEIKDKEFNETIVTIRLFGKMGEGKPSDIDFRQIFKRLYEKSAYFVMRNTSKLESHNTEKIAVDANKSSEDIENETIKNTIKNDESLKNREDLIKLIKTAISVLNIQKAEGENQSDFEKRVMHEAKTILDQID